MNPAFEPTAILAGDSAAATASSAHRVWIAQTQLKLEPWLAGSIAAHFAWLAAVSGRGEDLLWAFAVCAVLVALWSALRPARSPFEIASRGLALVAAASLLHAQAEPVIGAAAGLFLFWLGLAAVYYALLLNPIWALAVLALALAPAHSVATVPADLMSQAGCFCLFLGLLAIRFGVQLRRPSDALARGFIDHSTSLYNQAGLGAYGAELLQAARRDDQPLAVAVFDFSDLREVHAIYGSAISRKLIARVVKKLEAIAGDRGLAARTGTAEFTLVLPGVGREKAIQAIQRVLGRPTRVEFDAGDSEIVLVPDFVVQRVGAHLDSVVALQHELGSELVKIKAEEQRWHHYLQRERERHSRPMSLPAGDDKPLRTPGALSVSMLHTLPASLSVN